MSEAAVAVKLNNVVEVSEFDNPVMYRNYGDLAFEILKSPKHFVKVARYCPASMSISVGGLYFAGNGQVMIDHLPDSGYSNSAVNPENFNKDYFYLKNMPVEYKDAVFLEEEVWFLDLSDMSAEECKVEWENMGYYCVFHVTFKSGERKTFNASNYTKGYCFLWK